MFTDNLVPEKKQNLKQRKLDNYLGVDLKDYQCYELKTNAALESYQTNDLHYAITAMQKGLKLPTTVGLKRLRRRNSKKNVRTTGKRTKFVSNFDNQSNSNNPEDNLPEKQDTKIKPLNPLSPEELCLNSLRTQLRQEIVEQRGQTPKEEAQDPHIRRRVFKPKSKPIKKQQKSQRKPKFIRKKQNQLRRRIELIELVNENYDVLVTLFGRYRLAGRYTNRRGEGCPNISRKEVRDALTKYYQQKNEKMVELNDRTKIDKMIDDKIKQRQKAQRLSKKKQKQLKQQRKRVILNSDSDSDSDSYSHSHLDSDQS